MKKGQLIIVAKYMRLIQRKDGVGSEEYKGRMVWARQNICMDGILNNGVDSVEYLNGWDP